MKYRQDNMFNRIFEDMINTTPISCYKNKAYIRVHKITTHTRPLLITHHQVHMCNEQVKSHNLTQPSKPNKGPQAMFRLT